MIKKMEQIRNIAIVAHVDHGKTTIVDVMLRQSGVFRNNEIVENQVLDSNELERERGITIMAKNTAVLYHGVRINIVDTPGHADFGGEVERILKMVDGVLLVVDAFDGPMPQTRFVLQKALQMNLLPIVVINKVDRPDARPLAVLDQVLDLFIELGSTDAQLDFPVVYTSARLGLASQNLNTLLTALSKESSDLRFDALFQTICESVPCPMGDPDLPLQLLISNIQYDNYLGRIGIGRVERGRIFRNQPVAICGTGRPLTQHAKIAKLFRFEGLKRIEIEEAEPGEIVCIAGLPDINIGDTVCDPDEPEAIPFVHIDEPTLAMTFSVNDSPFSGTEGRFGTSRHLRERLLREMETNVSLHVEETDSPDRFVVKGRGELHLSVLIETMRREGYEFQVSKPKVITKEIDGVLCEPVELLWIDVPEAFVGIVIEKLGRRQAELTNMLPPEKGYVRLEFRIPSRGLIGYRSEFLTDTKGHGIMNSIISGFEPQKGDIETRGHGVLVAFETGEAVTYGLYNAQERGSLFIGPGTAVYEGMIVGSTPKTEDVVVNVCKRKHLTNMRAAGSDDALRLTPPVVMSLEQCLEFVADDELIEITPKSIRLRKQILNSEQRAKQRARKNGA